MTLSKRLEELRKRQEEFGYFLGVVILIGAIIMIVIAVMQ